MCGYVVSAQVCVYGGSKAALSGYGDRLSVGQGALESASLCFPDMRIPGVHHCAGLYVFGDWIEVPVPTELLPQFMVVFLE